MAFPEQGERVVWSSKAGGKTGYSQLAVMGIGALLFFGGSSLCTLPMLFASARSGDVGHVLTSLASSLVCILPMIAFIVIWAIPRMRPSFFLTDRDLVERKLLGGWERYPLEELRAAERYVAVYHGRYGPRQVVTDRLALVLQSRTGNRQVLFGPSKDAERLLDLLQYGVLSDWIDLTMLPAVDGAPAPAETRTDFFVCASTRSDGFDYGPLFIGPHRIVRFTEPLPAEVLGRLYSLLGRASGPGEAEQHVMEVVKNPSTGHYTELPRDATAPSLDGNRLTLTSPEATHSVELSASDAERLRGYLTLSRRAPDGR